MGIDGNEMADHLAVLGAFLREKQRGRDILEKAVKSKYKEILDQRKKKQKEKREQREKEKKATRKKG